MSRYSPAVFINGKMVTGCNHGEAFGKLTGKEQDDPDLMSGFYDPQCAKFLSEDKAVYFKTILMVRHADALEDRLTDLGKTQARQAGDHLVSLDTKDLHCCSSPCRRAIETADVFANCLHAEFVVTPPLRPREEDETNEQFGSRLNDLLDQLPRKSLLVCHSDVIEALLLITTGQVCQKVIPNCSLTLIHDGTAIYIAKGAGHD